MNYKELNSAFKRINKWYEKKVKVLSIKTRPFNTFEVFFNIINKVLSHNGKILYVWCSNDINNIKLKSYELYEKLNNDNLSSNLIDNIKTISIQHIKDIDEEYDLVIVDDISLFSKYSNKEIIDAVQDIYWKSKKIIIYSSDIVFPIGEKIDLVYLLSSNPIIEPRLLVTRIKLEDNIPLALFDYFKWFKENKKKVIISVPTEEKMNSVYNHYYKILRKINVRVVKYSREQDFKYIQDILNEYTNSVFVITNTLGEYLRTIPDLNIILLFSDDIYYSYKKIIYTCGTIQNQIDTPSEMIMVSKDISYDMEMAKSITRDFNKNLWEKRYLK